MLLSTSLPSQVNFANLVVQDTLPSNSLKALLIELVADKDCSGSAFWWVNSELIKAKDQRE